MEVAHGSRLKAGTTNFVIIPTNTYCQTILTSKFCVLPGAVVTINLYAMVFAAPAPHY